ncbi:hypothetical protein U9M48_027132 [Paspalum notatum var. saurae]|uniref:HTH cro/C1-type domain-containing protein n=1 Tax=Paspalum notatum var. saurae TaxID=547442 RepID=A0AAQ3TWQ2_PASNO
MALEFESEWLWKLCERAGPALGERAAAAAAAPRLCARERARAAAPRLWERGRERAGAEPWRRATRRQAPPRRSVHPPTAVPSRARRPFRPSRARPYRPSRAVPRRPARHPGPFVAQAWRPAAAVERVAAEVRAAIQKARVAKGWSQAELAKRISERAQVVQEYESGKAAPAQAVLAKMERALEVKLRGKGVGSPLAPGGGK